MIKYVERDGMFMAKLVSGEKVYMGTGATKEKAYADLVKKMNEDRFASYDFSLPTSAHNSSVRTRV